KSGACTPGKPKLAGKGQTCAVGPMQPGSWYWSGSEPSPYNIAGTLYVWLPDSGDPSRHSIEVVTRPVGITGDTRVGALDGLTLGSLEVVQRGQRGSSLEGGDPSGCCRRRGSGKRAGIRGLTIRDCIVERTGTGTVDGGGDASAIEVANATAPVLENNLVSYVGNRGNGITVRNSNGARILGNHVDHWNHNGIDIKGSRDVIVEGNVARDQPKVGAAFYTEFSENVLFRDNQAINVSNGFQISVDASASVISNSIKSAGTVIYF